MNQFLAKKKKTSNLLWIIVGIILILGLIFGIYFFKSNNSVTSKNPDNPLPGNIQYLPSEAEVQQKINQIKSSKNLDEQQATIEFLTTYAPHIKWWEINSLSELDEKIKLVNSKTGFPPFSSVPQVAKFNEETGKNFTYKSLLFLASIIPRESDGSMIEKG